jgi:uncharacterized protein (DUF488 family)
MKLYTIGYGGRQPQEFIVLLQRHGVRTLVDVRLRPDRASMGVYTQAKSVEKGIQGLLAQGGIQYVSLVELGNIFLGDPNWREQYTRLMSLAGHLLTEQLVRVPEPFCLMCAERRVTECHRRMIAEYLTQQGWVVEHIDGF